MDLPSLPLLTSLEWAQLARGRAAGAPLLQCSLDLGRSTSTVDLGDEVWRWQGREFPYPGKWRDRTVYYWSEDTFRPVQRYTTSLIKLVPTEWGAPTFEIDGIKMLPSARLSPYSDAERKVNLIQPRGKVILDTCGGLGYFADCCLRAGAKHVHSYERSADVLWLRTLNPWSPPGSPALSLHQGDIVECITSLADGSFDAALHDPPRFGIAGELYSQAFYHQLARVLVRNGLLFHYTGAPNRLTSGRDVPVEVTARLRTAGFDPRRIGDGILAKRR